MFIFIQWNQILNQKCWKTSFNLLYKKIINFLTIGQIKLGLSLNYWLLILKCIITLKCHHHSYRSLVILPKLKMLRHIIIIKYIQVPTPGGALQAVSRRGFMTLFNRDKWLEMTFCYISADVRVYIYTSPSEMLQYFILL